MTVALAARDLTKRYGPVAAVDGLNLEVEAGTLYGFLGPNGAGKTTTIRMFVGLIHPSAGEVEVLGRQVRPGHAADVLRRVGALVEEPAFWPYLSGHRNLVYFARAGRPATDARAREERIDEALATVNLSGAAGKKVKAYSQGMRQRLGIARALLGAPELLLLDEPTNGLDPQGIAEIRSLLRRLAGSGTTVFVSSHLLSEVEAMCDRVGVLAQGRLVADGPPSSLRATGDRLRVRVGDPDRAVTVLRGVDGVVLDGGVADPAVLRIRLNPPASSAAVAAALVRAGVALHELTPERERLEDVFLDLVGGADVPR